MPDKPDNSLAVANALQQQITTAMQQEIKATLAETEGLVRADSGYAGQNVEVVLERSQGGNIALQQ
jgi:hypothetical protein